MKNFEITVRNITCTFTPCTCIALCDNENEDARMDAILCVADNGTETVEHIVFGWEMPTSEEDAYDMFDDSTAWEALSEEHHMLPA